MKKTAIISFLVGVLCAGFAYQVYVNYQFQKAFNADHLVLAQVVDYLNKAITSNQKPQK